MVPGVESCHFWRVIREAERTIQPRPTSAAVPIESYEQTIVWNSGYRHRGARRVRRVSRQPQVHRLVEGGFSTHGYTTADFPRLTASDRMFARQFDTAIDRDVIDMVHDHVLSSLAGH